MPNVKSLSEHRNPPRSPDRETHLRRLALQLVVQLPADTQDALDTLDMAKTAVRAFLGQPGPIQQG